MTLKKIGENVVAIGNPSRLKKALSTGVVSGICSRKELVAIQANADISGGSSGGALFDGYGKLIGITSFNLKGSGRLDFAISIDEFIMN